MDKNQIISVLEELAEVYLYPSKPIRRLKKAEMATKSYQEWAFEELINEIERSDLPPTLVMENLYHKFDDYACRSKHNGMIFSIASDAILVILDAFNECKEAY